MADKSLVSIRPRVDQRIEPGVRLRLELREGNTLSFLCIEQTLPEQVHNPHCSRCEVEEEIDMDLDELRWLRDAVTTLIKKMEKTTKSVDD